jgi:hypothetical protein
MNSIEELKKDIVLKHMADGISIGYIRNLPKDDEIRALIISFHPSYAFWYACMVDQCPRDDTREATWKNSVWGLKYLREIDKLSPEGSPVDWLHPTRIIG